MNPDMSPRAISARLKRVSELRKVCLALGRSKPVKAVSARRAGSVQEGTQSYRPEKTSSEDGVSHKN